MYNIYVISTSNVLVLLCTAVPFSPLLAYFNIYNIPFSTTNILVLNMVFHAAGIQGVSCTDKSREEKRVYSSMYSSSTAVIMFGHNGLAAVNAIGTQLRDPDSALV